MSADLSQWRDQTPDPVWAELQRLKAELARLTLSGQVAEDERLVRCFVADDTPNCEEAHSALSRLAAQAQGYEAMKAERDALQEEKVGWATSLEQRAVAAEAECVRLKAELARLTPSGQVAEDEKAVGFALEAAAQYWSDTSQTVDDERAALSHLAAKAQGYEAMKAERDAMEERCKAEISRAITAESERDAAVADNVALYSDLREASRGLSAPLIARLQFTLDQPHPGVALLAQHAKAIVRARNEGLEEAATCAEKASQHRCDAYAFRCSCDWQSRLDGLADDIRSKKEPE